MNLQNLQKTMPTLRVRRCRTGTVAASTAGAPEGSMVGAVDSTVDAVGSTADAAGSTGAAADRMRGPLLVRA
jgi:hypothetical protein